MATPETGARVTRQRAAATVSSTPVAAAALSALGEQPAAPGGGTAGNGLQAGPLAASTAAGTGSSPGRGGRSAAAADDGRQPPAAGAPDGGRAGVLAAATLHALALPAPAPAGWAELAEADDAEARAQIPDTIAYLRTELVVREAALAELRTLLAQDKGIALERRNALGLPLAKPVAAAALPLAAPPTEEAGTAGGAGADAGANAGGGEGEGEGGAGGMENCAEGGESGADGAAAADGAGPAALTPAAAAKPALTPAAALLAAARAAAAFRGVSPTAGGVSFQAQAIVEGRHVHLGRYKLVGDAALAYDRASVILGRAPLQLNRPDASMEELQAFALPPGALHALVEARLRSDEARRAERAGRRKRGGGLLPVPPPPPKRLRGDEPPPPAHLAGEAVGRRLHILWPSCGAWFEGLIALYEARTRLHAVVYDDVEVAWVRLSELPAVRWAGGGVDYAQPKSLIGRRLHVFWPDDEAFYAGTVDRYAPPKGPDGGAGRWHITYDDGDQEHTDITQERVLWLPPDEPAPGVADAGAAPTVGSKRPREEGGGGGGGGSSGGAGGPSGGELAGTPGSDSPAVRPAAPPAPVPRPPVEGTLVGRRVRVWWPDEQEWFWAQVMHREPVSGRHRLVYEDGDVETLDLAAERISWAGPPPASAPPVALRTIGQLLPREYLAAAAQAPGPEAARGALLAAWAYMLRAGLTWEDLGQIRKIKAGEAPEDRPTVRVPWSTLDPLEILRGGLKPPAGAPHGCAPAGRSKAAAGVGRVSGAGTFCSGSGVLAPTGLCDNCRGPAGPSAGRCLWRAATWARLLEGRVDELVAARLWADGDLERVAEPTVIEAPGAAGGGAGGSGAGGSGPGGGGAGGSGTEDAAAAAAALKVAILDTRGLVTWEPNVLAEAPAPAWGFRYLRNTPPVDASTAGRCFCRGKDLPANSSSSSDPWVQAVRMLCPACGRVPYRVRVGAVGVQPAAKGRGVFALEAIPAGTRMFEYAGELLMPREADRRERDAARKPRGGAAAAAAAEEPPAAPASGGRTLRSRGDAPASPPAAAAAPSAPGPAMGPGRVPGIYSAAYRNGNVVDASQCGNVARFVNHTCGAAQKNIDSEEVLDPLHRSRVVYFTCRDVEAGEELLVSYRKDIRDGLPGARVTGTGRCVCGARECRKWLF